jgi:hypothetical protein
MRKLFCIVILVWSAFALASEDDKNAGTCAGYLATLQKSERSINTALAMADNPKRALGLAKEWIRRTQQSGPSVGIAMEGDRACKSIGIRALDMP